MQVAKVSCGGDHTLVLTQSGEVQAFGTSSNGQLGLGTRILETPQPLKGPFINYVVKNWLSAFFFLIIESEVEKSSKLKIDK